jgi:hypothetical protein
MVSEVMLMGEDITLVGTPQALIHVKGATPPCVEKGSGEGVDSAGGGSSTALLGRV